MNQLSRNEWLALGVACCGLIFLFGDELLQKVDSWKNTLLDQVEVRVPLEYEIERARRRTEELVALILKQREVVVRQSIDVDAIRQELAEAERQQQAQRDEILALRGQLSGESRADRLLHTQLQSAFDNYKLAAATLDARRDVLQIRSESLLAAQRDLQAMEERRLQLQLQVENLVARLERIQVRSSEDATTPDATVVAECESQLQRLDHRLKFMEGMLDEGRFMDSGLVLTLNTGEQDLGAEVDTYFGVAE